MVTCAFVARSSFRRRCEITRGRGGAEDPGVDSTSPSRNSVADESLSGSSAGSPLRISESHFSLSLFISLVFYFSTLPFLRKQRDPPHADARARLSRFAHVADVAHFAGDAGGALSESHVDDAKRRDVSRAIAVLGLAIQRAAFAPPEV